MWGVLSHLKWHDTSKLEKWKWKLDLLKIRRPKRISWGKVRWTIQSVSTTHQTSQKWYNQATHNKSTYTFPPSSFHPVFWRIFFSGLFMFTKVRSSQTRQQKGVCHSWSSLKPATSSTIRESLDFCFPTKKDRREFLNCSLRKPPFPSDHPFQNVPEKKNDTGKPAAIHRENAPWVHGWTFSPSLEGPRWVGKNRDLRDVKSPGWHPNVFIWLVVEPTHLKNISANWNLPQNRQIGLKIKKCLKPPTSL